MHKGDRPGRCFSRPALSPSMAYLLIPLAWRATLDIWPPPPPPPPLRFLSCKSSETASTSFAFPAAAATFVFRISLRGEANYAVSATTVQTHTHATVRTKPCSIFSTLQALARPAGDEKKKIQFLSPTGGRGRRRSTPIATSSSTTLFPLLPQLLNFPMTFGGVAKGISEEKRIFFLPG